MIKKIISKIFAKTKQLEFWELADRRLKIKLLKKDLEKFEKKPFAISDDRGVIKLCLTFSEVKEIYNIAKKQQQILNKIK